jgi:hypothetical protein
MFQVEGDVVVDKHGSASFSLGPSHHVKRHCRNVRIIAAAQLYQMPAGQPTNT